MKILLSISRSSVSILFGFFLGTVISVAVSSLNSPPPLSDGSPALQNYLQDVFENINRLDVTNTSPNASRKGKIGQSILYNNSGTFELYVNSNGNLTWQKI
jgi:hypothetical protein